MAVEILTDAPLALPSELGSYRVKDYDALPDEPRCELIFGRIYEMPSPSLGHQTVVMFLVSHFMRIAEACGARAWCAPLDVVLADHSVVQPDLIYVAAGREEILRQRVVGAPDLLIEVLSPGTARRDRGEKLSLYAQSGIREYWIAEADTRQIKFLVNEAGRFVVALPVGGIYRALNLPGVFLDLLDFWARVEAWQPRGASG